MKERLIRILGNYNRSRVFLYANVLGAFVLVNLAGNRLNCRMDLSRGGMNSLSASTEKVLQRLKEPLLVEAYISQNVPGEILGKLNPLISLLYEIDRTGGDRVQFRLINPVSPDEQKLAEARGIQGIPVEEARVDSSSVRLGFFGVYLQLGDKNAVLSLVGDGDIVQDLEYRFLREVKSMLRTRTSSGIALVSAQGTTEIRPWRQYADQTKDNLYAFKRLLEQDLGQIEEVGLADPVPVTVETLLLVGLPRLEDRELYHLDQFIMRGGSLVCMLKGFDFQLEQQDPRMAQMGLGGPGGGFATVPEEELRALNEWLGAYGVTVNGEILLEPEVAVAARDIEGQYVVKVPNPAWAFYARETGHIIGTNAAVLPIEQIVFPWFSGLDVKEALQPDARFSVLVQSSESAIARQSTALGLKELQNLGQAGTDRAVGRQVPLAVYAEGKFRSRYANRELPEGIDRAGFIARQGGQTGSKLVVIGTPYLVADILLKNELNLQIFEINKAFLANLLEVAAGDTDLLETRARVKTISQLDNFALIFGPNLGATLEALFMWFHILFVPVALAIYGTMRLFGRNRRRGLETTTAREGAS